MLNYSGKSLVSDIDGLLGNIDDYRKERKEEANQEEAASLSSTIQSGGGDAKAMARLVHLDPRLAQYTQAALQQQDQQKIQELNAQALKSKAFFAPMESIKDQSSMNSYLLNQAREVAAGTGSPEEKEEELDEIRDMMAMDFNQARMKAQRELIIAGDTEAVTRFNAAPKDTRTTEMKNFDYGVANPAFAKSQIPAPVAAKDNTPSLVKDLRSRHDKFTGDLKKVDVAFRKVNSAPESAAGDMALIFNYMKLLDPGSTVREGEFATAEQAAGVSDRVMNAYNKTLTGERLNPAQRTDFINTAKSAYAAQRDAADESVRLLLEQADQDNVSRERVMGPSALKGFTDRESARQEAASKKRMKFNPQPGLLE